MAKYKVGIISLGCDKNRIDTEIILAKLENSYEITNNPEEADILIVNTCGFIESSKQESIDTIMDMGEYKKKHNCKILVATGCLTQRYGKELIELMPEIDILLGVNDYTDLIKHIDKFLVDKEKIVKCEYSNESINEGKRVITTDKHSAYIRIAEGCNNFCTYCIIPKIRGKFRSRKLENIVNEAKALSENGVEELILVAQDTTIYGEDLYGEKSLVKLIQELSKIDKLKWVRILYCYPEEINDELIEEMATNDKVCNYLDIPIQHISDNILKRMARKTNKETIVNTIKKLRNRMPDMVLRTSLIVGFPGETEEDFNELKEFVKEYKLDNLGVFTYSQEEGTPASTMENQVEENIKKKRQRELMIIQQDLCKCLNKEKVNKVYEVLVDKENDQYYVGRTKGMAPEIDGLVYIEKTTKMNKGDFVKIKVNKALEYDLIGVVEDELS
ncbi:30S ribosomal protein S12 methylthiotransferase RimO [Clostridium frigidicarnis]|uniref:Ribosomal protein uS12 methylthiotransferase RimO n=1 Tax=Clostridium frigidicarnis TaxID=84698 RepID=A0A1I0WL02_9CLOT|nr:30S ribosomal protein S12 methylthiotransferase RimO [Clostridium frigidicarnis]SFA89429.1 SSU ribosomal protein S12P methylthiotransferase [Clostridium frigidicarnis]